MEEPPADELLRELGFVTPSECVTKQFPYSLSPATFLIELLRDRQELAIDRLPKILHANIPDFSYERYGHSSLLGLLQDESLQHMIDDEIEISLGKPNTYMISSRKNPKEPRTAPTLQVPQENSRSQRKLGLSSFRPRFADSFQPRSSWKWFRRRVPSL